MKKKLFTTVLVIAMLTGTITGCATPSSESNSKSVATATTTATEKTISYAIPSDVTSLDPRDATATVTAAVVSHLYSTLLKTDDNNQLVLDAAESYEVIDKNTYKFTLRKGIKFHDGEELTSEDVKYTLDTIRDKDATYALKTDFSFMYCEPIDKYNLYIKTDEPNASTLLRLNYIKILPKHYVEKVGDKEFAAHPIGSGSYKFVKREKDAYVEMEAFDDYFGEKPVVDHLICKIIPDASARIAALEAGEVDLISGVSTSQVERLKKTSGIKVVSKPSTRTVYFSINTFADGPLKNVLVRQAINYAVDKTTIVKGVLDGYATEIKTLALPGFKGYDDSVAGYKYDPEKAKALLAQAGYPNGFELEMGGSFSGLNNGSDVAQAVAAQLGQIGIKVTVVEKDSNTIKDEYKAKTTSGLTMYSFGGPYNNINLITKNVVGTGMRYSAFSDAKLDELIKKIDTTIDDKESAPYFTQVQQYLTDSAPVLTMYQQHSICAYSDKLKNWVSRADEMLILTGTDKAE